MKWGLISIAMGLASCETPSQSRQGLTPMPVDSVIYVEENSGMPPTFKRIYWRYRVNGSWSICHVPVMVGDSVLVPKVD